MTSLILTVLYLAKDTVHRWFSRLSSPLARVLVVFFLSLCALTFLGTYVISAKAMKDRIRQQGGDMVHASCYATETGHIPMPDAAEAERLFGAESAVLQSAGFVQYGNRRSLPVFTYDFRRAGQFMPLLTESGAPTLLCSPTGNPTFPEGPMDVRTAQNGMEFTVCVKHLPADHLLMRMQPGGFILVQPDTPDLPMDRGMQRAVFRIKNLQSAEELKKVEDYFTTLTRLEGVQGMVTSAAPLLEEMDTILGNQNQCRAAFCLGIIAIVGILLTALAGMEYRQNEYIYTLLKSFGIHPLMLVLGFFVENMLLVGLSFWAAVEVFMRLQGLMAEQFFKMGQYSLTLPEIMPEIQLIATALLFCVLVSGLPILVAANREIGRVLK